MADDTDGVGRLNNNSISFNGSVMASRIGEKVPGWVERLLIPAMESRVRSIVKDEISHFEAVVDAKFNAFDEKFETKFNAFDEKFETKFNAFDEKFETKFNALNEKFETRLDALDEKLDAKFGTLDVKIDSLDKQFPVIQEMAEIKARLAQLEKNRA